MTLIVDNPFLNLRLARVGVLLAYVAVGMPRVENRRRSTSPIILNV
jgi:hypothetical protein